MALQSILRTNITVKQVLKMIYVLLQFANVHIGLILFVSLLYGKRSSSEIAA